MASTTHWKQHIEDWRAGGLTQSAYCRQHGLNPKTFSGHARALPAAAKRPLAEPPALVPVRIGPAHPPADQPLVPRTASGHRLELPVSAGPRWVAELLLCLG